MTIRACLNGGVVCVALVSSILCENLRGDEAVTVINNRYDRSFEFVGFSADGKQVISVGEDKVIRQWDWWKQEQVAEPMVGKSMVRVIHWTFAKSHYK